MRLLLVTLLLGAACTGQVSGGGDPDAAPAGADGAVALADAPIAPVPDAPPPPVDALPPPPIDANTLDCIPEGPQDCSPGPGTGEGAECFDGTSCYLMAVKAAVTGTIAAHPEWFSTDNPAGCPFILDVDAFMDAVVADLVAGGLCAIRDPNAPGEEVTVKHDNAFSENFDIVASTGCARYGDAIYTSTCAPAWW